MSFGHEPIDFQMDWWYVIMHHVIFNSTIDVYLQCCTGSQTDQTVYLPIVEEVYPKPRLLPPVLPGDFAPRLNVLHGDPMVWWIGQFLKFILRPHPTISKQLVDYAKKMNFQKPYVG